MITVKEGEKNIYIKQEDEIYIVKDRRRREGKRIKEF